MIDGRDKVLSLNSLSVIVVMVAVGFAHFLVILLLGLVIFFLGLAHLLVFFVGFLAVIVRWSGMSVIIAGIIWTRSRVYLHTRAFGRQPQVEICLRVQGERSGNGAGKDDGIFP